VLLFDLAHVLFVQVENIITSHISVHGFDSVMILLRLIELVLIFFQEIILLFKDLIIDLHFLIFNRHEFVYICTIIGRLAIKDTSFSILSFKIKPISI
jgi:hypothetical protein